MSIKRNYFVKVNEMLFNDGQIRRLRRLTGDDTSIIIYFKLQLLALNSDGFVSLDYNHKGFYEDLAFEIDENVAVTENTIKAMEQLQLIQFISDDSFLLLHNPSLDAPMGKEKLKRWQASERVKRHREKQNDDFGLYATCNANDTQSVTHPVTHFVTHFVTHSNTEKQPNTDENGESVTHFVTQDVTHPVTHPSVKNPPTDKILDKILDKTLEKSSSTTTSVNFQKSVTQTNDQEQSFDSVEEVAEENPKQIFKKIFDAYNEICVDLPKAKSLSEPRRKKMRARLTRFSYNDFLTVFKLAQESDFLKGNNDRSWRADLDWLLSEQNFVKVLEEKYKNKSNNSKSNNQNESWIKTTPNNNSTGFRPFKIQ